MTTLLDPFPSSDWNDSTARHLLNRAGFGIPRERVAHLTAVGRQKAVDALVDYEQYPADAPKPPFIPSAKDYYAYRAAQRSGDADEKREARQEYVREQRAHVAQLRLWWLDRMYTSPRPLEEKMALFWHGHFATSSRKVKESLAAYAINQLFREHATGNVKMLTTLVGQSRSMLDYLDNQRNVKGSPNENWARELMELFTLGVGNYTERDIKESARAFTGWKFSDNGFVYREEQHDFGEKEFMGRRGTFDGWDVIDIIFQQPSAARFLSAKLWSFFAYEDPEPELIDALAATFRESNYELKPLLRTMFNAQAFYSPRAMGTQVKSPVQLVLQVAHDLQLQPAPYGAMARHTAELGQNLFEPPNVKGWDGGRKWINANSLVSRYNLPKSLLVASIAADEGAFDTMMQSDSEAMDMMKAGSPAQAAKNVMSLLPREERRELASELSEAKGYEKRVVLDQYILERPLGELWNPKPLLSAMEFATAGECVDRLAARYLATAISGESRGILIEALTHSRDAAQPLTPENVDAARLEETFRLLLSMAEYQLC